MRIKFVKLIIAKLQKQSLGSYRNEVSEVMKVMGMKFAKFYGKIL